MSKVTKKKVTKKTASRKKATRKNASIAPANTGPLAGKEPSASKEPLIQGSEADSPRDVDPSSSFMVENANTEMADAQPNETNTQSVKTSKSSAPKTNTSKTSSVDGSIDETRESPTEKQPTRAPNTVSNETSTTPKKSGSALAVIAILVSLLALAGAAYTWYDAQVRQVNAASKLVTDVADVGSQVAILNDRVESLRSDRDDLVTASQLELRIAQMQDQSREQLTQVSASQVAVVEQIGVLQDNLKQGVTDFILDDVAQLLKSANVSVLVLGNIEGALNALRIAEQQLQDLADPRFTPVRQKILVDIAALESVELVDIEQLSVSIQALVVGIENLDLINEPEQTSQNTLSLSGEQPEGPVGFREGLREMGRDFLSLFTIKVQRVDQPPTPLLAPKERYFLDLNLSLALNKAELAALQSRPVIFKQSLAEARQWVVAYFDVDTPRVKAFLEALSTLEKTQLDVELPSVAEGYAEFISIRGQR